MATVVEHSLTVTGAQVSFELPVVEHSSTVTGARVSFGGVKGSQLLGGVKGKGCESKCALPGRGSVLCQEVCSARKCALPGSVLCEERGSARKCALKGKCALPGRGRGASQLWAPCC